MYTLISQSPRLALICLEIYFQKRIMSIERGVYVSRCTISDQS